MKYFIRKIKDCISSFFLYSDGGNGGGAWKEKKNVLFESMRVCDEWRGSVRIGCW